MRLQDKVAIITGGANGIGKAACELFLKQGAKVVIADYDQSSGRELENTLKADGKDAMFIQLDVSDGDSVQQMVKGVLEHYGKIDILINNAGTTKDAMLVKMTAEDFDRVIDVNLKGVFNCTQAIVPHMIANGYGKVINTSSVSGVYGNIGQTNYSATKAAVIGMTKTWAKELGRKGINVNAVAPGFTKTAMVEKMPEKVIQHMESIVSLPRLGEVEDIANAYLFLASDESSYITGHVLHVDGGIMM
ncbi:3-oxoacyl-ACP reductase FabG [Lysinibacillus yapensis]|uniref:3-oxoacyl-[acyl-carrier-protein] reductase n=1 Tax=Ureibacillus yapensis TaxID=2304605 RepID=A0A396SGR8_9BACL|nr:3-oxoacyl-ACP reductase FabG [Lysinibacillus yapensis]RHW37666.1 3-oxoacyl-ACP reductase FabG [Lysinibacillus yapensis]